MCNKIYFENLLPSSSKQQIGLFFRPLVRFIHCWYFRFPFIESIFFHGFFSVITDEKVNVLLWLNNNLLWSPRSSLMHKSSYSIRLKTIFFYRVDIFEIHCGACVSCCIVIVSQVPKFFRFSHLFTQQISLLLSWCPWGESHAIIIVNAFHHIKICRKKIKNI